MLAARIPEDTHRALLHLAVDQDTTVQSLVERAVNRLLARSTERAEQRA